MANTIDAVNRRFGVNASDRTLTLSELDFDLSAYDIFAFLAYGGSVVVVDEMQRRDARAWLQLIRQRHVNVISCVPALLDMLLMANGGEPLARLASRDAGWRSDLARPGTTMVAGHERRSVR
ncbi:hypothetical protein CJI59_36850, partial [Streptomyces sp. Alain-F2R5]